MERTLFFFLEHTHTHTHTQKKLDKKEVFYEKLSLI